MSNINGTMMQYFEWYMECNQSLWNTISQRAEELASLGITALWLPPAYKGIGGKDEVGYGVYDVYDLGEFDQKGTIKTKYGSKDEYLNCIQALFQNNIKSYADIVLNHKMGADKLQEIPASKVEWENHNIDNQANDYIKVGTKFTFPGRNNKYSDFKWNWTHFNGIDYDENKKEHSIFKFQNKDWDNTVDDEYGNYDYLMGADLDFSNEEVVQECKKWGEWYINTTKVDGVRLDAVKHINYKFYLEWVKYIKEKTKKDIFAVGEYFSGDISKLHKYITETEGLISLFDVPLHYNLKNASENEQYDLSKILDNTLMKENPCKAVTFVDNHDTQPGQALESFIKDWFRQSAYSIILLRSEGYPCVFYGDFEGIKHDNIEPVKDIKKLIKLRRDKAYGEQTDYFDNPHYIGWTRKGDKEHKDSGLAVVISNSEDGEKNMYIGEEFANKTFVDALENCKENVVVNDKGIGCFKVKAKSVSVWICK